MVDQWIVDEMASLGWKLATRDVGKHKFWHAIKFYWYDTLVAKVDMSGMCRGCTRDNFYDPSADVPIRVYLLLFAANGIDVKLPTGPE